MFPIALDLAHAPAALAGSGEAALRRLMLLRASGATPAVFAAPGDAALEFAAGDSLVPRLPEAADLSGLRLLFVAGLAPGASARIADLAREQGILVNVEDRPDLCDFHVPAIVRRGDLTLTVATGGRSPALAHLLRRRLEKEFDQDWADRLDQVANWRRAWREQGIAASELTALTERRLNERGWL
jgi:precorrin-2 dehydrogenase / sirohydrochlorin ferrochelatase